MPLIEWGPKLAFGIRVIDHDHRMLVDIVNAFHDALRGGESHRVIGSTLDALQRYVREHFRREERLLANSPFPYLADHIARHHELERMVADLNTRWAEDPDSVDARGMHQFLKDWLVNHIQQCDAAYVAYLKDNAPGERPARPDNDAEPDSGTENDTPVSVVVRVPRGRVPTLRSAADVLADGGRRADQLEKLVSA